MSKEKYVSIKVKESDRQKLKIKAAEKGLTMAELLTLILSKRD